VKTLKSLANRMRRLANEISAAETPEFIVISNTLRARKWRPDCINDMHDSLTFVQEEFAETLEDRASMYDDWICLVSHKVLPKDFSSARLSSRACALLCKVRNKEGPLG
jgi:hypothetical protein